MDALHSFAKSHRSSLRALGAIASLVGYGSFCIVLWNAIRADGGLAYDATSYWQAAQRAARGDPLYWSVGIGDPAAYRHIPTFAQVLVPLSAMPLAVLTWLYRLVALFCLRYLVGSWRAVGWSLLLPPVWIELLVLNLTFPIAAVSRSALRGGVIGGLALPIAAILKYSSVLLAPYLWIRRPELRWPMVVGSVVVAAGLTIHAIVDPDTWIAFLSSLAQQSQSANFGSDVNNQLLVLVPNTVGDFLLRLGIGAGLVAIAAWRRWDWLAFTAVTIAVPTLWVARLAALVAVPRLWLEDRAEGSLSASRSPRAASQSSNATRLRAPREPL